MVYIYILGRKLVERDLVLMVGVTYISFWIKNGDFPLFFQLIFLTTNMCTYKWRPSRSTATTHWVESVDQSKQPNPFSSLNPLSNPNNKKKTMHSPLFFLHHHLLSFLPFCRNILSWPRIYMNNPISISLFVTSLSLPFTPRHDSPLYPITLYKKHYLTRNPCPS